jgi:hypothetical protein
MRQRWLVGWFGVGLVALLTACGSGATGGMNSNDWATIGAYEQGVTELETQVAVLVTTVPTPAPATPGVPFAEAWTVGIERVERGASFPNPLDEGDAPPIIEARGVFLAIRLTATNDTLDPAARFPWWSLRLRDDEARTFTPQEEATAAYVAGDAGLRRPESYQPGLTYDEAVVFDVPVNAERLTLRSADDSLRIRFHTDEAVPAGALDGTQVPTATAKVATPISATTGVPSPAVLATSTPPTVMPTARPSGPTAAELATTTAVATTPTATANPTVIAIADSSPVPTSAVLLPPPPAVATPIATPAPTSPTARTTTPSPSATATPRASPAETPSPTALPMPTVTPRPAPTSAALPALRLVAPTPTSTPTLRPSTRARCHPCRLDDAAAARPGA